MGGASVTKRGELMPLNMAIPECPKAEPGAQGGPSAPKVSSSSRPGVNEIKHDSCWWPLSDSNRHDLAIEGF